MIILVNALVMCAVGVEFEFRIGQTVP